MILTDEMLMAAFRYRDTKLWERLDDSMIFAFRLSDGETGYCCVMGNAGEHLALGFFRGEKGFTSYLKSLMANGLPENDMIEFMYSYECINCDFMNSSTANELDKEAKARIREFAKANGLKIRRPNGWPDFTCHSKHKMPRGIVDKCDAQDITEALNAAIALANRINSDEDLLELGFDPMRTYASNKGGKTIPMLIPNSDGTYEWSTTKTPAFIKEDYPKPTYDNQIASTQIKALKHNGTFQCRAIHGPGIVEGDDGIPYMPTMMLFVLEEDTFVFPVISDMAVEEDPMPILHNLASVILENDFCPKTLKVKDELTYNLLADFCKKTGIKLLKVDEIHEFDMAWNYMRMMM